MPPKTYVGWATRFADPGDIDAYKAAKAAGKTENQALQVGDNGIGAPALGSVSTPNTFGVAMPHDVLVSHFGNDPAAWRTARANVVSGDQTVQVPIIDIGPGSKPRANGVVADFSYPLSVAMGTGGRAPVKVDLVANAGPDYTTHPDDFTEEQRRIGTQLGGMGPLVGLASSPGPALAFNNNSAVLNDLLSEEDKKRRLGLMN